MDFENVKSSLERLGYTVSCFENKEEASEYLNEKIDQTTVSFGGSKTLTEMNLYESLEKHNEVIWHARVKEGESAAELKKKAMLTSVYISSVNGLSETGTIYNIDGFGNRIASIVFGHDKVYLVVGKNKIAKTDEEALARARNIAGMMNAKRFNKQTPCAIKGDKCYDCKSPERICHILQVMWLKPMDSDIEVILINEDLGF